KDSPGGAAPLLRWFRRRGDRLEVQASGVLVACVRAVADDLKADGLARPEYGSALISGAEQHPRDAGAWPDLGWGLATILAVHRHLGAYGQHDVGVALVVVVGREEDILHPVLLDRGGVALRRVAELSRRGRVRIDHRPAEHECHDSELMVAFDLEVGIDAP